MSDHVQYQRRQANKATRPRRRGAGAIGLLLVSALMLSTVVACSSDADDSPEDGAPEMGIEEKEFAPTSPELIAAALESGEIDEPTSLLYRTWAYFRDPQLPEQYIGEDATYEHLLLAEVRAKLDGLPTEFQEKIRPYLLRPNDPASAFSAEPVDDSHAAPDPAPASALHTGTALQVSAPTSTTEKKEPLKTCTADWKTQEVPNTGFRVWVCDDPITLGGFEADEALDRLAGVVAKYVPQMKADIGELRPDDPDSQTPLGHSLLPDFVADDLIDIYAVPSGWHGPWRYAPERDPDKGGMPNYGRTVSTPAKTPVANADSAYILMSMDHIHDRGLFERILVHELFHVFQYSLNIGVNPLWWTEGTAEWAASHYVRDDSARLHNARMDLVMDVAAPSILRTDDVPVYGAYIWPFFMEQEVGPESIIDVWHELATLPKGVSEEGVIELLNQHLNMSENYPELAVRLVNRDLQGSPISPKFQDLDPNFPTDRHARLGEFTLDEEPLELDARYLSGLGYRNYRVKVEEPDNHPAGTGVAVHVAGQAPSVSGIAPVLQGLIRDTDGNYSQVPISYTGDGDTVCVDEDMILVLANVSTQWTDLTDGWLTLDRLDGEPCTRVEVQDPNMFIPVFDGDVVQVDGEEGDDQPDDTQVVVTVRDPDPEKIRDYEVKVRVDGETLNGPREFSWPLDNFDNIGDGVWRRIEDLPLDNDLDDTNRPLTIDARLERSGDPVHQDSPTVELHGQQESMCYLEADITGQVWHEIYERGSSAYQPYPVSLHERYEPPLGVYLATTGGYEDTVMRITSLHPSEPPTYDEDTFGIDMMDFGQLIPEGETGSYDVNLTLAYRDYTNVPWAKIPMGEDLPNQGHGQPLPGSELHMLKGSATFEVTKTLQDSGIFEGTITGTFTDEHAYNHGDRLDVELKFATADEC